MTGLDPEVPRQPAAPAEEVGARSRPGEELSVWGCPEHRRLMAVRLDDRVDAGEVGQFGTDPEEIFRERLYPRPDPLGRIARERLLRIVGQCRQARGFDPDDRRIPGRIEGGDRLAEVVACGIELAGRDERQTAAHRLLDHPHPHARMLEDGDRGRKDPRREVVRPRIREEDDLAEAVGGPSARLGAGSPPAPERRRRERRNRPAGIDPRQPLPSAPTPGTRATRLTSRATGVRAFASAGGSRAHSAREAASDPDRTGGGLRPCMWPYPCPSGTRRRTPCRTDRGRAPRRRRGSPTRS